MWGACIRYIRIGYRILDFTFAYILDNICTHAGIQLGFSQAKTLSVSFIFSEDFIKIQFEIDEGKFAEKNPFLSWFICGSNFK